MGTLVMRGNSPQVNNTAKALITAVSHLWVALQAAAPIHLFSTTGSWLSPPIAAALPSPTVPHPLINITAKLPAKTALSPQ